ncbi:Rrf2 family transcriptional regulator [Myxococcus landrumensis]|uniref:Rrf2 family transcriptional regulator n=1 Tax=Myxococcus landrumensis TaxID=2813577 RepID=A0ABX7N8Q0_9BACT|nr:Rrf2 family transcriptional regulator [Myxococcus landrumus]QSQ14769.1 Rrf2 family transcriptional regulator [Myxococcus landrumus]
MNSRFTMAAHIVAMLSKCACSDSGPLTSEAMARSIQTNPVVVRRLLGDLARAGLVETKRGARGGVTLAKRCDEITLRDIYEAVEEGGELFGRHPVGPAPDCDIGPCVAQYLEGVFGRAEAALKQSLERTTVAQMSSDLTALFQEIHPPKDSTG